MGSPVSLFIDLYIEFVTQKRSKTTGIHDARIVWKHLLYMNIYNMGCIQQLSSKILHFNFLFFIGSNWKSRCFRPRRKTWSSGKSI